MTTAMTMSTTEIRDLRVGAKPTSDDVADVLFVSGCTSALTSVLLP
jgi:hypothetical protein